ncbi:MAG: M20/M25/M40 family metallo-hydrolase, partial [Bacteroides sp.]
YKTSDPDIILHITEISETPGESGDFKVLDKLSTDAVVNIINSLPNGIIAMSSDMPGMVETSLNLGVMNIDKDRVVMHYLLRSSKDSSLDYLAARMQCISSLLGAEAEISAQYPAWEYVPDSKLRAVMIEAYKDIYKEQPRVESIHAGVECGLLSAKIKGLDCVSFGPDILDIHTPRERLDIASVQRTWEYLLEVLKRL